MFVIVTVHTVIPFVNVGMFLAEFDARYQFQHGIDLNTSEGEFHGDVAIYLVELEDTSAAIHYENDELSLPPNAKIHRSIEGDHTNIQILFEHTEP